MRFSVLLDSYTVTGVPKMQRQLAEELARRGHEVDLVIGRRDSYPTEPLPPEVRLVLLRARRMIFALGSIARHLRGRRPDAVLSAEDHLNAVALAAAAVARSGAKVCVTSHVPLLRRDHRPWRKSYWMIKAMARLYPRATCVGAVSSGLGDELAAVLGLPRDAVTTLHNPVVGPTAVAAMEAPCPHDWLLEDRPVLCACGTLTRRKGLDVLLRALAQLRGDTDARLICVGEGDQRANLEALARELGVDGEVDFVGAKANPYAFMARSSAFVLSSEFEGLPTVLVEALACGTPVVATDCPYGPHEILEGGRYGRLVPVRDAERLAEALRETLRDPPDPADLRARAMDFTAARAVDRYLAALGMSDAT